VPFFFLPSAALLLALRVVVVFCLGILAI
jgi:hypothetical protein